MNPLRIRRQVEGQVRHRAGVSPLGVGVVPLEFKLRRLHQRRRRAAIRQLVISAFWGAGLLSIAAFLLALSTAAFRP
jgi:hypothetical protein